MFKKKNEKITFVSTVSGLESSEDILPRPAKYFIPQWFKDIPSTIPSSVKVCPSFPDYFSQGYIIPMWCDVKLAYTKETDKWEWKTPSSVFTWETHSPEQLINHKTPNFNGVDGQFVFKAISPWRIITPPGWSVLQLPLFYHFNKEWSVLPGIIDTDIQNEVNQQVLYHGNDKEIEIKQGDPFALLIPFKRSNKLDYEVRYQNNNDQESFHKQFLEATGKFLPNGYYRKLQRKRDKDA
jgi:hypothetical protein